jgi:hypothetical protein
MGFQSEQRFRISRKPGGGLILIQPEIRSPRAFLWRILEDIGHIHARVFSDAGD